MSRIGRRVRHADDWASPHERARARAAQRLDWPLDAHESAWLDRHLAECAPCRSLAADYLDIRNRLRALRTETPPPPRDLWARTAAAIEQESRRSRPPRRTRVAGAPLGALSGVLVIAVVLGATLLSNAPRPAVVPEASEAGVPASQAVAVLSPRGTPLAVLAGDVRFIRPDADGSYDYSRLGVDEVCAPDAEEDCPAARDAYATALAIEAEPQAIIGSPDDNRAVVVGASDGSKANDVIVMSLPEADATAAPTDEPVTPEPTETSDIATATPTATGVVTATPTENTGSEPPSTSADPSTLPSVRPSEVPSAPPSDAPTAEPSAVPSDEPPTATPSTLPSGDPTPTPESIAIASDLIVVGSTAAFSPNGNWFAFTGRPADESAGPDIYVWQVGDEVARPITADHRSVFASWAGEMVVGSRPGEGDLGAGTSAPAAFLVDPITGAETVLGEAGWRPIVAPSRDRALVVNGPVTVADGGRSIQSAGGNLELRTWDAAEGASPDDAIVVLDTAGSALDAHWDETGTAFAVWIEDPADPSFGRLSLYFVDPETGALEQPENAPRDEPALAGFSIGDGRLAWATPAGQGGEGSRVLVVAWNEDGVGTIETAPGEEAVVIR